MAKDLHIVGFRIGRETFGVPISLVHEIVRVPDITSVPDAPECVEGVINLRGRIISVIDLRKRFGETKIVSNRKNRILVAEIERRVVGLIVDAASEGEERDGDQHRRGDQARSGVLEPEPLADRVEDEGGEDQEPAEQRPARRRAPRELRLRPLSFPASGAAGAIPYGFVDVSAAGAGRVFCQSDSGDPVKTPW